MAAPKQDIEGNDSHMIMEGSQAVVIEDSHAVVIEDSQVMKGSSAVIEGTDVMLKMGDSEAAEFGGTGLQDDAASEEDSADSPVIVKEEDLQDGEYGHNDQILGLVHNKKNEFAEDDNTLETNQEGEMLLQNLVN